MIDENTFYEILSNEIGFDELGKRFTYKL
jgi:hypothetical protein